jgi:UPF0755 protein
MIIKKQEKKSKKGLTIFLIGFAVLFAIAIFEGYYSYMLKVTPSDSSTSIPFEIQKGESLSKIASNLKDNDLIKSDFIFLTYLKRENLDTKIQAGEHLLSPNMTVPEIAKIIQKAIDKQKTMTILEGWSVKNISDYIGTQGISSTLFEDCLENCVFDNDFITEEIRSNKYEGFLFPDTYNISLNATPEQIIGKMLDNFSNKTKNITTESNNELNDFVKNKSLFEIITVASMIEREVRTEKDRSLVSGIIWNRLKIGMGLGIDATLLYELGDWEAIITADVLSEDSDYNTRRKLGLPPSPICQPSLKSIIAAFNPEDSEYLYYLTPDTGEVIYGRTLEEHNINKQKHLN